jgi:hypothetical protein
MSIKSTAIFNIVENVPLGVVMTTSSCLFAGTPMWTANFWINIVIAAFTGTLVNLVFPIQGWMRRFATKCHCHPSSLAGHLVGNLPAALVSVSIVGSVLSAYNVRAFPAFLFSFLHTFILLYVILYLASLVLVPVAMKVACMADKS